MKKFSFLNHTFEIVMGPSSPNPGLCREYKAKGISYMSTCDAKMWINIDGKEWFRIEYPEEFVTYATLAETESELFKFLETLSYDFKIKRMVEAGILPEQPQQIQISINTSKHTIPDEVHRND